MGKYNFDLCVPRKGTNCYKWDDLKGSYGEEDLLPFWIADTEFYTLPDLTAALTERLRKPAYSYTFPDDGFLDSIIHWYKKRHGAEIERRDLFHVPGVVFAIGRIIETFSREGDAVIINPPVYESFIDMIPRLKRKIAEAPLVVRKGHYELDFDAIEAQMKAGAKIYLLCSPHNPTGRVWTKEELAKIAALCCEYHVLLIADEIHSDIVYGETAFTPIISVSQEAEKCAIIVNSPAKTFNVASLKTAYLISKNQEILSEAKEAIACYHLGVTFLGYLGCRTVYEKGDDYVDELCAYIRSNAEFVCDYLAQHAPRIKTYVPESTFLMWLDFREYGLSQEELEKYLVERAGVALCPGVHYGRQGYGFMRLNIGEPRALLEQGLKQIVDAFALL